jgi:hypothetical protein
MYYIISEDKDEQFSKEIGEQTMKPTYEELVKKLRQLTNILADQNQDDSYDEIIGHTITEAEDVLDRAGE